MKVLQINSFFTVGGPPRIVNGLYDTLLASGHSCKIAAAREKPYVPRDSIQIGTSLGTYRNALACRLLDNDGFCAKSATRKLITQIREYDPDVIQLHNLHGYYIHIPTLFDYLRTCGKKVVWTLHDCWAFTGHCAHYDYEGCEKWRYGCNNCPLKKTYPSSLFLDRSAQNYGKKKAAFTGIPDMTVVTPSEWLAEEVRKSFLKEYPVVCIPNGIDLSEFTPTENDFRRKYHLGAHKIVLGVAQNWSDKKGLQDFVRLSELLPDSHRIVLIGLTPKQIAKMPKNILALPRTNTTWELAEAYSAADVFVNPSVEETMGMTTVEALACGTPVVVYDKTAVPEVVDARSGIVVKAGDTEALRDAVCAIDLSADDCVARAGEYEKQKKYQAYLKLYEM